MLVLTIIVLFLLARHIMWAIHLNKMRREFIRSLYPKKGDF